MTFLGHLISYLFLLFSMWPVFIVLFIGLSLALYGVLMHKMKKVFKVAIYELKLMCFSSKFLILSVLAFIIMDVFFTITEFAPFIFALSAYRI